MLNPLRLTTYLSVALTAFLAKPVLSLPVVQPSQGKEVASEVNVPVCYMQTADGNILDLSSLCDKQKIATIRLRRPAAPRVYNPALIKKFDDELYGEGN